jgi:hypothetical protein
MPPLPLPLAIACAIFVDFFFIRLALSIRSGKSLFKPPKERNPYLNFSMRRFIFVVIFVHFILGFNFAIRHNLVGIGLTIITCALVCLFLLFYWSKYKEKFIEDEIYW